MMIRNRLFALAILFLLLPDAGRAASSHKNKPQPPVQVTITQGHPSTSTAAVKPGDVVPISLKIIPAIDATEMRIVCTLNEGVELVSGELEWTGPAARGEVRSLAFTVRSSRNGKGSVTSRVELYSGNDLLFTTTAVHELGNVTKDEPPRPVGTRKDRKGQDVEEYR